MTGWVSDVIRGLSSHIAVSGDADSVEVRAAVSATLSQSLVTPTTALSELGLTSEGLWSVSQGGASMPSRWQVGVLLPPTTTATTTGAVSTPVVDSFLRGGVGREVLQGVALSVIRSHYAAAKVACVTLALLGEHSAEFRPYLAEVRVPD